MTTKETEEIVRQINESLREAIKGRIGDPPDPMVMARHLLRASGIDAEPISAEWGDEGNLHMSVPLAYPINFISQTVIGDDES